MEPEKLMQKPPSSRLAGIAFSAAVFILGSCSPEFYRETADDEVGTVIHEVRESEDWVIPEPDENFDLESAPLDVRTVGAPALVEDFGSVPSPAVLAEEAEQAKEASAAGAGRDPTEEVPAPPIDEADREPAAVPETETEPAIGPGTEGLREEDRSSADVPDARRGSEGEREMSVEADSAGETGPEDPPARGVGAGASSSASDSGTESDEGAGEGLPPAPETAPGAESSPDLPPGDEDESVAEGEIGPDSGFDGLGSQAALASLSGGIPGAHRVPSRILTLAEALTLAFANNREFQSQRESVYLSALDLTLARYAFAPQFFGVMTGDFRHDAGDEELGEVTGSWGWDQVLASGARVSINLFQNALQFFTGDRREVARNVFNATVTQPLLRGFGSTVTLEPLIQARRDLLYQIRAFRRFRKVFAVRVIAEYYRVLQERDRITNEYNNWASLVENRRRVKELADAGRIEVLEMDQARQQELQAEDRYSAAVAQYESVLDDFKVTLGIPIDEHISLAADELESLVQRGVAPLPVSVAEAVRAAFDLRVDWRTALDQLEDAERRVVVLRDALRAQLDVSGEVSLASGEDGAQKPLDFDVGNLEYGFGFTLDLPLDRKRERNAWVSSLIGYRRSERDLSLFEDEIRLTIRDAYRALEREIVSYPIQQTSVELARARVESTTTLRLAGRASTRDVLESQAALIDARNALTRSLINYTVARLQFYRDVGALRVLPDGSVVELSIGIEEE